MPKVSVMAAPNLPWPTLDSKILGTLFVAVKDHGAFQANLDTLDEIPIHTGMNSNNYNWTESYEPAHSSQSASSSILACMGINAPSIKMDSQAKYGLVARGEAHFYLRIPTNPEYREKIWDHAIGALIVKDLDGRPLNFTMGRNLGKLSGIAAVNSHESYGKVVNVYNNTKSK